MQSVALRGILQLEQNADGRKRVERRGLAAQDTLAQGAYLQARFPGLLHFLFFQTALRTGQQAHSFVEFGGQAQSRAR